MGVNIWIFFEKWKYMRNKFSLFGEKIVFLKPNSNPNQNKHETNY